MIKIENAVLPSPAQWEAVIRGARNPMNSWDKMDSYSTYITDEDTLETADFEYFIGENDLDLLNRLSKAGKDHRKFMRMIPVIVDVTAPMYWWKEYDTYKVGTVRNSCSTMHKIQAKEFTLDDFSCENLFSDLTEDVLDSLGETIADFDDISTTINSMDLMQMIIRLLNAYREKFIETKEKKYWWQMIQLLPSSYNQKSTLFLNYEVLANMYHSRKYHKLDEWREFCKWIESLPYSELITGGPNNE